MSDFIKKQREAAPKRGYDAGSHKKRERNGIIVMQLRSQGLPNGEFSLITAKHIFIIWLSVDSLDLLMDAFDFPP
jgi:hypothetical protein